MDQERTYPAGVTILDVQPGEVRETTINPTKDGYKIKRFAVPDDLCPHFWIEALSVEGEPQLVSGPVPATVFAASREPMPLACPPCPAGGEIKLRVRSIAKEPHTFQGAFFGPDRAWLCA